MTKYTATLIEDTSTGDLILPLPTELLNQLGWEFGDTLVWSDNSNGSFSLTKKESNDS